MKMRYTAVLIALFFGSGVFAQLDSNGLHLAVDSLDKRMISEIDAFESSNRDFLILRVNDSLSDWYHSYFCIYVVDSCSASYVLLLNTVDEVVHFTRISRDRIIRSGTSRCYNELNEIKRDLNNGFLAKSIKQQPANWKNETYVLYGKVNEDYIFETFDHSFTATFHSGMVYEIVCNKFGLYCPKN